MDRDEKGRLVTRHQPYKMEPGEGLKPGIYEVEVFEKDDIDWPMTIKIVLIFAFFLTCRWWGPYFVEWMRPK